ncbi:hypothetical protein [Mycolicibacterium brumae]|uniref:DUF7937 domain-containing protein n=1 Tax=Mycolicibacterium brumae TaxID=85968 RepID=UPI000B1ADECC|nr:hypothetical protein [Mycolicibacterium brumae]MCV7194244.1 hypothetical protein [Mycolicibacterium brumae]RWA19276.1 hypothetical protein MBRU_17105 [Mycolicibacterium brumae DSM 44177]UWW10431.1 hypothetical protein L2Z93_003561 [Mycolicibacterium brumae]
MHETTTPNRRPDAIRDGLGAAFALLALLLPWNVRFGLTIEGSAHWMFALLIIATLGVWASALITHRRLGEDAQPESLSRLRLLLSTPYLLLATAAVLFSLIGSIALGGSGVVAPGVGPGVWFGVAGALLCAQPVFGGGTTSGRWSRSARMITDVSVGLAVLAVLFTLYWRLRRVVPDIVAGEAVGQNLAVTVAFLLYSAVALAPILVAARWMRSGEESDRLVVTLLGASTLVAGALVWWLPTGREIDGFHGIAQNTGVATVGFQGYLAWVAVAAIVGPLALLRAVGRSASGNLAWQNATRKALLLIAVWSAGSAILRITDLVTAGTLGLPVMPFDQTAMLAFDALTALLAGWVARNGYDSLPKLGMRAVLVGLVTLTVCRVVLGIVLVPRVESFAPTEYDDIFGNDLYQQITSTFDVVLCVLAAAVLGLALTVLGRSPRKRVTAGAGARRTAPAGAPGSSAASPAPAASAAAASAPAAPAPAASAAPPVSRTAEQPRIAGPAIARPAVSSQSEPSAPQADSPASLPEDDAPRIAGPKIARPTETE